MFSWFDIHIRKSFSWRLKWFSTLKIESENAQFLPARLYFCLQDIKISFDQADFYTKIPTKILLASPSLRFFLLLCYLKHNVRPFVSCLSPPCISGLLHIFPCYPIINRHLPKVYVLRGNLIRLRKPSHGELICSTAWWLDRCAKCRMFKREKKS